MHTRGCSTWILDAHIFSELRLVSHWRDLNKMSSIYLLWMFTPRGKLSCFLQYFRHLRGRYTQLSWTTFERTVQEKLLAFCLNKLRFRLKQLIPISIQDEGRFAFEDSVNCMVAPYARHSLEHHQLTNESLPLSSIQEHHIPYHIGKIVITAIQILFGNLGN